MLGTQVNALIAFVRPGSFGFDKGLVLSYELIYLSKTCVSNARESPWGTPMPSPRAVIKFANAPPPGWRRK